MAEFTEVDAITIRAQIRALNKEKPNSVTKIDSKMDRICPGFKMNCLLPSEDTLTLMKHYSPCMGKLRSMLDIETNDLMY
jgi:hypothetical protein